MLQKIRWFFLLAAIVLLVIVAFQNSTPVDLALLTYRGTHSLTLMLLATTASGFLLGALATLWHQRGRRKRKEARQRAGKAAKAEKRRRKAEEKASTAAAPGPSGGGSGQGDTHPLL
ncbi:MULTISPECIES: LapA family protein [Crateriforma]|uniref:Lipopolysaccharide assembly protein A domain-containing protein n=1 Tax=Crateriforma conspicua TaxID=2527996 RepID=A0A5C6FWK1_9PLAN|nr:MULTISPECIES: LapA family protein [Crateriforma]TWU67367.1 hypothetical protein V7x_29410 [Crateriforma conspicua]